MITPAHFVRLGEDNPHQARYQQFRGMLFAFLRQARGRQSALATHLHVNRQTASRWFASPHTSPPAWAALAANVWLHSRITAEARSHLLSLVSPPGQRQPNQKRANTTPTQQSLI